MHDLLNLPPQSPRTWLTPQQAALIAEVSPSAIAAWCDRYGIGRKVGGRWRVDPAALHRLLTGAPAEQVAA